MLSEHENIWYITRLKIATRLANGRYTKEHLFNEMMNITHSERNE